MILIHLHLKKQYLFGSKVKLFFLDLESMKLSFTDVELPPQVHLKLKDLPNASLADLKIWLSFRGDSIKATDTAVKCRTKYV